jgi:amino acid transporter
MERRLGCYPFAIWFFLALEGVANVAEETIKPQRNILIGFGSALLTLGSACASSLFCRQYRGSRLGSYCISCRQQGRQAIVRCPLALAIITGENKWLYHLLISIGLLGLIASFHGIILAAGRATFEMGRLRYIMPAVGKVHPKFKTPANALLLNMGVGILALLTGKTGDIIIMACFGALYAHDFWHVEYAEITAYRTGNATTFPHTGLSLFSHHCTVLCRYCAYSHDYDLYHYLFVICRDVGGRVYLVCSYL